MMNFDVYVGVEQLKQHLGEHYQELPLYCAAGTCAIYDISLYHSRVNAGPFFIICSSFSVVFHQFSITQGDFLRWIARSSEGDGVRTRRALQTYYSRGDVPALTNWVVLPKRLVEHAEPETAAFYSLQADVEAQVRSSSPHPHLILTPSS